ncbi:threonine transporter RhtB [Fischerella thermalis CCMEE 5273]|nr:threonine transporter RhtB [Fischerella thermalis CCMEE 5273]
MEIMDLMYFAGISIVLTLMPGPDILFVISQSITNNSKDGVAVALGLCTGLVFHTIASAFGISALLYHSSLSFQLLKVAGAIYLFYLAWLALRENQSKHAEESSNEVVEGNSLSTLYRRGILMNLLNPKVSLFFMAFLPQFIHSKPGAILVYMQMVILGFVFILQALLVFTVVSIIAYRLGRNFMNNSIKSKWVNRGKAGIYLLLGTQLFLMDNK